MKLHLLVQFSIHLFQNLYINQNTFILVWLQIYAELYTVFHGPQNTFDTFSSKYPKERYTLEVAPAINPQIASINGTR